MRQGGPNDVAMGDHSHDTLRVCLPEPLDDTYAPLLHLEQAFAIRKGSIDRIVEDLVGHGMAPHLAKRFAFPVTVAHLPQVRDFLNGFLETSGQEFCRLARADQRTGENMSDYKRGENLGRQACLLLP